MLPLYKLYVTQSGLRDPGQLGRMVSFVKEGGIFDKESMRKFHENNPQAHVGPVIQIAEFEDGKQYIADGHHRIIAIVKAGRMDLYDSEYEIIRWKYSDYMNIHFDSKWVTPFDPRVEIRYPDYLNYKKQVYEKLNQSKEVAINFINLNKHLYAKHRDITVIPGLLYELEKQGFHL